MKTEIDAVCAANQGFIGEFRPEKNEGVQPSSVALCGCVTDYRTFREDYQKLVDFVNWYNEFR